MNISVISLFKFPSIAEVEVCFIEVDVFCTWVPRQVSSFSVYWLTYQEKGVKLALEPATTIPNGFS